MHNEYNSVLALVCLIASLSSKTISLAVTLELIQILDINHKICFCEYSDFHKSLAFGKQHENRSPV